MERQQQQQATAAAPVSPLVLVSGCKGESRTLRSGFKQLARHLKAARCDVRRLEPGGLSAAGLAQAAIVVFGGPTQPFSPEELDALVAYLRGGGNLLVLAGEGGEAAAGANLNALLADHGISLAADCVIQTSFNSHRCSHPKQVLVTDGMLSPDMVAYCASNSRQARRGGGAAMGRDENSRPPPAFVYPHGATLRAQAPAVAFLSSGQAAHPSNMTIGAAWWQEGGGGGRLAVLGSAAMFDDEWLGQEDNTPLLDFLLGWMLKDPACCLSAKNMAEPEFVDPRPVTHIAELAARPRVCLQEHGELPRDITRLFADKLFKLDMSFVPQVGALRRRLGANAVLRRGGRLPLWRPPLEVPFPALQPAVFPPAFRELPPPALELFDLDEELAGPLERLNQITAQYLAAPRGGAGGSAAQQQQQPSQQQQQQLERYIGECAALLGLRSSGGGTAKQQLAEVLEAVVSCKQPDCYG